MSDSITVLKAAVIILKTYCEAHEYCKGCLLNKFCDEDVICSDPCKWDIEKIFEGDDEDD